MEQITQNIKELQALVETRDKAIINLAIQIASFRELEIAIQKKMIDIDILTGQQDDPPLSVVALEVIEEEKRGKYPPAKF